MKNLLRLLYRPTLALLLTTAMPAWAEAPRLGEVQRAYADVDYETTRRLAQAALEHGHHDKASTGELYLLWATSAAALDQADEARMAFLHALSVNPGSKLERSLSPKIRAPYLEARGALGAADGPPPLEVSLGVRRQNLELTLRDAAQLAGSIELATRTSPSEPFVRRQLKPSATQRLPAPPGGELQYFVQVLDRYGNVLTEQGSAEEPERLSRVVSRPSPTADRGSERGRNRTPYFVAAGALAALGLGAGGVSTAMYLRREDAAREWNGTGCEQPGQTRHEQCRDVEERRRRAEYLSIGFAAASGGLLVGSLVSLLLTPKASADHEVELSAAPGNLALRLRGSF